MVKPAIKELSAHLAPKPLAVRDFWRKWTTCCQRNFHNASPEVQCIERLKIALDTEPMFVQLNEGLEMLLLSNRGESVQLTARAWLALTWVSLTAFASEHTRKNATTARKDETRKTAVAALEKARTLFILYEGKAIGGVSVQDWIKKGPWLSSAALWTLLFKHGLHLVHPAKEPLYYALREYWLELEVTTPHLGAHLCARAKPPEMAAWGLPRPLNVSSVQSVLRSGRRWALRAQNAMHDTIAACAPAPQWTGVYVFSIWLHRQDNAIACTPDELALLDRFMVPSDLGYWLTLVHDCAHKKGQHRNVLGALDALNLQEDSFYDQASNILQGLQLFSELEEVELAVAAWIRWNEIKHQEVVLLPDLN